MMKTCVAIPAMANSLRAIRQPRAVQYRLNSKKSLLRRFQYFIETTDWDERYLCNRWIDKMCLGGVVVAMIYYTPILAHVLLK
jgi:hypothetical protein